MATKSNSKRRPADNPFRVQRHPSIRYATGSALTAFAKRLAALHHRAALVGPHGTGKTTLREDLERHYLRLGWRIVRLAFHPHTWPPWNAWGAVLAAPRDRTLVTVDGVEQLPRPLWRLLRSVRRGPLLVTSHHDCGLPVLHRHTTDSTVLQQIVEALGGPRALDYDALWAKHDGNIRSCLLDCYDRWATGAL
ncbi:MAG: hypothetical protein AAGA48_22350 [Myxococcota bacterium]